MIIIGFRHEESQIDRPCGLLDIAQLIRGRQKSRIQQGAEKGSARHELMHEADPLGLQLIGQQSEASRIAAGSVQTLDQTGLDRVAAHSEDDWDRGCRTLCHDRGIVTTDSHQDGHVTTDKVGRERWQPIVFTMGPAKLESYVATFHEAAPGSVLGGMRRQDKTNPAAPGRS